MKHYDFDTPIERRGTDSLKFDSAESSHRSSDLMPLWVADMDFPTVPEVVNALVARAKHPIYGYTENGAEERRAEVGWLRRRYGLEVDPEWIL